MRIALGIEYEGTDFLGWQRLSHGATVQGSVEAALSFVAGAPVEVMCSGRTDARVHARCQVIHFDTDAVRSHRGWMLGTNSQLPDSIAVRWVRDVDESFHARFSAKARRYRYTILNRPVRAALEARFVTWERVALAVEPMRRAARALIGEHDFTAFRALACQSRTPMRCVHDISIVQDGERIAIEIQANAFLHHMVRNIVGSLLKVGRGEKPVEWVGELLAGRDRARAAPTAAASGLTFLYPLYPAIFGLPQEVSFADPSLIPARILRGDEQKAFAP